MATAIGSPAFLDDRDEDSIPDFPSVPAVHSNWTQLSVGDVAEPKAAEGAPVPGPVPAEPLVLVSFSSCDCSFMIDAW